jgi:endo-1,3-1,4-beta-glycanase ExoK
MRQLLAGVCLVALALSCGFEPASPVDQHNVAGTGISGTSTSGGSATTGGTPAGNGGATSMAGQPGGTSGTASSPGGNASLGGAESGGSVTGGSGGSGTAGAGGTTEPVDSHFKLAWRDDFDAFDSARWTKQTHTFDENLARFSADNAVVEGGFLKLRVTKVQNGDKAYSAGEVASKGLFTFGRFAGRIKFCGGSGLVSSLFTYKDDVDTSWQEIDIEHLGNNPKSIQYNLISGNLANRVYQPKVVNFQFAPPTEFHDYAFEWKPDGIDFFVDGVHSHHDTQATLKDAARLHMNAWPTDNSVTSFAGPFDATAVPCEAQYDWVEAYTYTP